MGILNYKISGDVPLSINNSDDSDEDYVNNFQKEYNDGDLPLKDTEGTIIPQIQIRGDYLIAKYGTADDNKHKGYKNFKSFIGRLPAVKVVFKKPYQDPYQDTYYNSLGFSRVTIDDQVYYTTENYQLLDKVSERIETTNTIPNPNPDGYVVFPAPIYKQAIHHVTQHMHMYKLSNKRATIVLQNNARQLWEAINNAETAKRNNLYDDNDDTFRGNILSAQRRLIRTPVDGVPSNVADHIQQWQLEVSQPDISPQQLENASLELVKRLPLTMHTITDEGMEKSSPLTVAMAKKYFYSSADRMWIYEHGGIAVNQAEMDERIDFLMRFIHESQFDDLYDTMEFMSGHILNASASLKVSPTPVRNDVNELKDKKQRRVEYGNLYEYVEDGNKKVEYDGIVIMENGTPVAQDKARYNDWMQLVNQYRNLEAERRLVMKNKLTMDYRIAAESYGNRYKGALDDIIVIGGDVDQSVGGWAIAAIIVGIVIMMIIYTLIKDDAEFPVWIHYAAALGSGFAASAAVLSYRYYQLQSEKNHLK